MTVNSPSSLPVPAEAATPTPASDGRRKGLGRGLDALFGTAAPMVAEGLPASEATGGTPLMVPIEHLSAGRYQPRHDFDQEGLRDLAESIRGKGILQPILVRPRANVSGRFEIIAGERRWRAAQLAQIHLVPVLVRSFTDIEAAEVALIENLQRRDLSALEEAEGYRRLMDEFSRSSEELASALGKSRAHVANMVRLLALPAPVKTMLSDGRLTAGHARALLNAADPVGLAEAVVRKGLNVRQTERLATEAGGVRPRSAPLRERAHKDPDLAALERELGNRLGIRVEIDAQGRGGVVHLHYGSLEQLDGILLCLNRPFTTGDEARPAEEPLDADDAAHALAAEFTRMPILE